MTQPPLTLSVYCCTEHKQQSPKGWKGNTMNKTTTTKATTSKQTKRQQQAQANNQKRIATTKANIEKATQDIDNIVNAKAIETIQILKQYGKESRQFTDIAQQLCTILVQSKLKRLYNNENTSNEQQRITKAKISAYMDKDGHGNRIQTALDELQKLYVVRYNKDGERVTVCTDKKTAQAIEKKIVDLTALGNDGGHDLPQDAFLKLWDYITKANIDTMQDDYLLQPFEQVILKSKVYRNGNLKDKSLWQYTTTNIIKEITKEISRKIESERSVKDTLVPYEEVTTELDGESIRQYHKTKAIYCDTVTDFNGKITTITNNQTTEQFFESIPQKCNLSKMETVVLKLHYLDGVSFTEIADTYQISIDQINVHNNRLKDKIVKSGIFAKHGLTEKADNGQKATTIYMFDIKGEYITAFESIGQAHKTLNISKGCISENLKGKRKTAGGYVFAYTR